MDTDDEPQSLSAYLRGKREEAGLSQRQLGQASGVNHSFIARLESGEVTKPKPEYLQALANALTLAPDEVADLFALIGANSPLPEPRAYFRRKFGIDADQAEVLANLVEEFQAKQTGQRKEESHDETN